jgi:hypothetical protein
MTEALEPAMVALNAADEAKDEMCPFCHEEPIGHHDEEAEKEVDDKVVSKPSGLKCNVVRRKDGDLPHTTAAHHAISAMQCYARIRRLVRMGNLAKYDINAPVNGIGLPTTHWRLKYPEGSEKKKYGDLVDPPPGGKQYVAFSLMKELKAQWHVGHHAFDVDLNLLDKDSWDSKGSEESDDDDNGHMVSYDTSIIRKLLKLLTSLESHALCEEKDWKDKFKQEMDKISNEIKDLLNKFKSKKPSSSAPLFVSRMAFDFARKTNPVPPDPRDAIVA